ncbi:hypothetical protein [Clostridium sp.]|nr:hypothetical protein [Clostridium sp.]MCI9070548.1 hypothetical protein [Clostridium sp.]
MVEELGGTHKLEQAREELIGIVYSIDDVLKLNAKIDLGYNVSEKEIAFAAVKMMENFVELFK